jgi:hypothetical protein
LMKSAYPFAPTHFSALKSLRNAQANDLAVFSPHQSQTRLSETLKKSKSHGVSVSAFPPSFLVESLKTGQ